MQAEEINVSYSSAIFLPREKVVHAEIADNSDA